MKCGNIVKSVVEIPGCKLVCDVTGDQKQEPVLFIHGLPTSRRLWREVLPEMVNYHCLAPDLMGLGETVVGDEVTNLGIDAQASVLFELMTSLKIGNFSVVCHDQGGAIAQRMIVLCPERIKALVITDSACYDNWPVQAVKRIAMLNKVSPWLMHFLCERGILQWLEASTSFSAFRAGMHDNSKLTDTAILEYLRPLADPARRKRLMNVVLACDPSLTMSAVPHLRKFTAPTMVLWAKNDFYFPVSWGKRLVDDIPGARELVTVPDCGHFWPEEKPIEFATIIREFLNEVFRKEMTIRK